MGRRKDLTAKEREDIKDHLLTRWDDDHLQYGAVSETAANFAVDKSCVTKIWAKLLTHHLNDPDGLWNVTSGKKENFGRLKYDPVEFVNAVRALPLRRRSTVREMARWLDLPVTTVFRLSKKHLIWVSSHLKPALTDENKLSRIEFCLSERGENGVYREMYDRVHIDETWFRLTRVAEHYFLCPGEPRPNRTTAHKSHIPQLMFLAAVARPRWDVQRNQWFDGKIGQYPIADQVPAARASRNRPRGTLEWKNKNVTAVVYTEYLFERIIPDIMDKWPRDGNLRIHLQQDNAPSHISPEEFREEWLLMKPVLEDVHGGGLDWDFYLYSQPANSPDTNLNDLAYFASAKAQYWKNPGDNINEMVERLAEIFAAYPRYKLNRGFLTLMTCMNDIIESQGGNDYKITHMNKAGLEREDNLPISIPVTAAAADWDP